MRAGMCAQEQNPREAGAGGGARTLRPNSPCARNRRASRFTPPPDPLPSRGGGAVGVAPRVVPCRGPPMKFTLSWLKEHLETDASIDEIVERMTMIGLEVESVENAGAKLAAFSVARIVSAAKHPNADKLQRLPSRNQGRLARNRLRRAECARGAGHRVCADRYISFPEAASRWRRGRCAAWFPTACFARARNWNSIPMPMAFSNSIRRSKSARRWPKRCSLNDPVIDIEVTPNRPDWLGVHGIARDLAAAGVGKLVAKPDLARAGTFRIAGKRWEPRAPEACAAVRRTAHSRRQERAFAGLAATALARGGFAAAQCAGRYHQSDLARSRAAAARLRCGQTERRGARAHGPRRRELQGARRQGVRRNARPCA